MDYLKLLKEELKLDFNKIIFAGHDAGFNESLFDLKPKNFLRFAKEDFSEKNQKGFINSLTNSKRAIDCQIDTVLHFLGIHHDNSLIEANSIINLTEFGKSNMPFKLKLITALGFAPVGLISNVRTLRNKLEHYYEVPSIEETRDALELAELFLLAIEKRLNPFQDSLVLSDKNNIIMEENGRDYTITNGIHLERHSSNGKIAIRLIKEKKWLKTKKWLKKDQPEYYFLIKILNCFEDNHELLIAVTQFLRFLKHPIPEKNIALQKI